MITRHKPSNTTQTRQVANRWSIKVDPLANRLQRRWLTRAGALTSGLRDIGALELRVLRQAIMVPAPDEALALGLPARQPAFVREICMSINGIDSVVARSAVSLKARTGSWQAMGKLGRRPLADILYDDPRVARSAFETARLISPHPLASIARLVVNDSNRTAPQTLWARRSVFWRGQQALLVSECFLPAFWALAHSSSAANG